MGCDIHAFAEVRRDGQWRAVTDEVFPLDAWERGYFKRTHGAEPFHGRHYGAFGFLAGVRNYSDIRPLSSPKGLPADVSEHVRQQYDDWSTDGHSHSWLSLRDLQSVDYDAPIEDRRITVRTGPNSWNGGGTAEPGGGTQTTLRAFLGDHFMSHVEALKSLGEPDDVRVVFWFDN